MQNFKLFRFLNIFIAYKSAGYLRFLDKLFRILHYYQGQKIENLCIEKCPSRVNKSNLDPTSESR